MYAFIHSFEAGTHYVTQAVLEPVATLLPQQPSVLVLGLQVCPNTASLRLWLLRKLALHLRSVPALDFLRAMMHDCSW